MLARPKVCVHLRGLGRHIRGAGLGRCTSVSTGRSKRLNPLTQPYFHQPHVLAVSELFKRKNMTDSGDACRDAAAVMTAFVYLLEVWGGIDVEITDPTKWPGLHPGKPSFLNQRSLMITKCNRAQPSETLYGNRRGRGGAERKEKGEGGGGGG